MSPAAGHPEDGGDRPATPTDIWRAEAPAVLAALLRRSGDLGHCEDAVAEALLAAAEQWPTEGTPANPRGWLIRVASRRLIDRQRSERAREHRELSTAVRDRVDGEQARSAEDDAHAPTGDDSLQLLLLCCHPALTAPSQVALTLRAVGGLTTAQIAAGFLVPESTMAQRISRAKATLAAAGARFDAVPADELPGRLHAVRHVLYLIFNEGYAASAGPAVVDADLVVEAIRLTTGLHRVDPDDHETAGLLALMLLTHARTPARITDLGELVPLAEQDRTRWDADAIAHGVAILERVLPAGPVGPFQLQAAVAAVHAEASTAADTDWPQICQLYRMLVALAPSPAARLGLAAAVGMAYGPTAGLRAVEPLLADAPAGQRHRVLATRAHLLELDGHRARAHADYLEAARRTRSIPEQRYLNRCAERTLTT